MLGPNHGISNKDTKMSKQQSPRQLVRSRLTAALLFGCLVLGAAFAAPGQAFATPPAQEGGGSVYLPHIAHQSCKVTKSASLMGAQLYDGAPDGSPYHQPLMNSGASWVRVAVEWAKVEPSNTTPDKYKWAHADAQTALAVQRCWPLVVTIGSNPAWASSLSEGYLDKVGVDELAQLMGAMVERYDGDGVQDAPGSPKIPYFELYNEPDVGANSLDERWGDHPDKYAEMLKAVYPAIKQANPAAQVVFGGIAFDFFTDQDKLHPENNGPFVRSFFANVLKNGGGPYFDIMNYHFYPLFGLNWTEDPPMDGPGLVEKTEAVRAIMRTYNVDKPIIITEAGWHNNATIPHGDDTLQVRYVQKLYTQAKASGVPMLAWWPFADAGGSYTYNSGLVTHAINGNVTLKSAYFAYAVYAREVAGATFVAEIKAGADTKVYKLQDNAKGRTIYVAWTNQTDLNTAFGSALYPYKDTTRSGTITLVASAATVYDAFWTEVASIADADDGRSDGRVKVPVNGDPKYIIVKGG
jgi:hypothetical protein